MTMESSGRLEHEMSGIGSAEEPVVSIQRLGTADPVEAHLAWGRLIGNEQVVVSGPFDWLEAVPSGVQVLLASARRHGPGVVERLDVAGIRVLGMQPENDGAVALVTLARPSAHAHARLSMDLGEFEAALAVNSNVQEILESMGVLRPEINLLDPSAVLGPVGEWEQVRRNSLVRLSLSSNPGDVGILWCFFWSPWCRDRTEKWW